MIKDKMKNKENIADDNQQLIINIQNILSNDYKSSINHQFERTDISCAIDFNKNSLYQNKKITKESYNSFIKFTLRYLFTFYKNKYEIINQDSFDHLYTNLISQKKYKSLIESKKDLFDFNDQLIESSYLYKKFNVFCCMGFLGLLVLIF